MLNVRRCSCKVRVILVRFYSNLNLFDGFLEYLQIQNFVKISFVGAEFFRLDIQTDRHDEANSNFSRFCERAEKWIVKNGVGDMSWIACELG